MTFDIPLPFVAEQMDKQTNGKYRIKIEDNRQFFFSISPLLFFFGKFLTEVTPIHISIIVQEVGTHTHMQFHIIYYACILRNIFSQLRSFFSHFAMCKKWEKYYHSS